MRRIRLALAILCGMAAPAAAQFIPNPPVNGLLYNAGGVTPIGTLPALTANQLLGALSAGAPGGISVPSCFTSSNALIWTPGVGFGCNTISGGGGGGTVTTTGTPASGNLTQFSGASSITNGNLSGDVTTAGTLATTVGSIGGKAVSLGGAFTMSGAFGFTGTVTGTTAVTFPTSGTLLTTTGSGASLTGILWSQIGSTPTTLAGYGITSPLPVAQGGTAASSASGTALDNITGFSSTGLIARTGAGAYSFTAPGTGVLTALAINVGTAGAFVTNGGALGTPSSGTATNLTGTASGLTAGTVTTNANLTGPITSTGNATAIASQTGTGSTFVMSVGPTITGSFTATGLVTNADLANASTTVNGQTCTLGGTCTISASAGTITPGTTTIASGTTNGLLYDNAGVLGNLATANNGVLVTNGSGVPSISTTLPSALSIPSPTFTGTVAGTGTIPLSVLASQSANTVVGALTATNPSALAVPSCSSAGNALNWTSGTGFGCATGYLTANQTITLSGDTTGSGTTAITTSTTKIGGVAASLGGAFTMSGAFTFTGTVTANTSVTFPTSGTLLTTTGSGASLTGITYSQLPALSANQVLGALTATTPSGLSVPSCSGATNALIWTSGSGFGCNTISAGTGNVSTTGTPANGNLTKFSGAATITNGDLSGDVTTSGTLATTVASIGGKAVSLAASLTTSGANALTLTTTGVTNVTLPTSGTLLTTTGSGAGLTGLVYTALPALSANQLLGALTATTPSGQSVPSCSAAGNALNWTSGTGFGCATGYLTANQTITLSGDTTGSGATAITTSTTKIGGVAVSLGGAFTMSGAFTFAGTVTANTAVTFPTSGTLLTTTGSGASLTGITYSQLPALAANQLLGALTATTPSGQAVPSCSAAGNALNWTSGTGFGCATGYLTSSGAVTTFSAGTTGLTPNSATSGAITLAGTLAAANGGTGQTSVANAFASFFQSVATTLGDTVYGGAAGTPTRLAGVTATQPGILSSTGTGAAAQAPAWISSTGSGNVVLATSPTITTPVLSGTVTGTYTLGGTPSIAASALTGTTLPAGIVSSSLTSVGTIATGVWQGTAVAAGFGGTGISTSASTGVAQVSSGTWSVSTTLQSGLTISSPVLSGTVTGTYTLGGTPSIAGTALTGTNLSATIITTNIAAVGTISTGVWNGTAVGSQWGGTGQNSSASTGVPYVTSGTWAFSNALPSAVTATTQTGGNNTTALATTAYVDSENGLVTSTTISTTGGTTTLTAAQYSVPNIIVTGALTSAATIVFPNNGNWRVQNNTTGAFLVTAKTAAGTGITVSQTYSRDIVANGTNVIVGDSDYFSVGSYTNTSSGALDPFYGCLRKSVSQICRIVSFGDSIITCYQIAPCTYGPYMGWNSPILALRNELLKSFVQYSTGLRVPFRLINSNTTVDGGEGGYTLTSGTVAVSTIYGPQVAGYALSGGSLLNCTVSCVLTINVGQGYRALNIYCVQTTTNTGWTVTVGGTSLGTACGTTAGSTQGAVQTFSASALTTATASSWSISGTTLTVTTVASGTFAVGGVLSGTSVTGGTTIIQQMTGATAGGAGTYQLSASSTASTGTLTQTGGLVNSTFTLTSTGTSSFLGGYEAITTMGSTGVVVDNMGEGGIPAAFWTSATGLGWFNLLAGQVGLCIHEGGQNDSQNPAVVTPAQVIANFQTVATACQNRGASFSFFIPTPYNSTTANQYAFIQQYEWSYGQNPTGYGAAAGTQPWDIMTLSDAWAGQGVGGVSGTGGVPNFVSQDTAANVQASVAAGLLNQSDYQHPTDFGSCLITQYMFKHLFARNTFNCNYNVLTTQPNNRTTLFAAMTNTGTSFLTICEGANAVCAVGNSHPFNFQIIGDQELHIRCEGVIQVSAAATVAMTLNGTGTPQILSQKLRTTPTLTTLSEAIVRTATYATAVTSASLTTTGTDLSLEYFANVRAPATANSNTTVNVQIKPSTGTLTLQPGFTCIAE